jgi:hypothetical protein
MRASRSDRKSPPVFDRHPAKAEAKGRSDKRRCRGRQLQHVCGHDDRRTS